MRFRFLLVVLLIAAALPAQEIRFTPNTIVDHSATAGEPIIKADSKDNIYITTPFGFSTTVSLLWKSTDGGRTFIPLGTPIVRDAVTGPGGGDTDVDFDAANRLYYIDLSALCITTAVSEDEGNTFPPDRTNPVACVGENDLSAPQDDRQWIVGFGDGIAYATWRNLLVSLGANFHLFKTTDGGRNWDGGRAIGSVSQSGPLRIDKTKRKVNAGGVAKDAILIYQVYYSPATSIRVFRITDFNDGSPLVVESRTIASRPQSVANVFPNLAVGRDGSLYAAWSEGAHTIYMAASQDRGDTWSAPVRVSTTSGTNIMPWIVAGDRGRADIVWYHGSLANNSTSPDNKWEILMAQTLNAFDAAPSFATANVNDTLIHSGEICLRGLNCDLPTSPGDRSFLEYPSVWIDSRGAAVVTFNDNSNQSTGAYVMFAKQVAGPSLYADVGSVDDTGTGTVTIGQPTAGELIATSTVAAAGRHSLPAANFDFDESGDAKFPDHGAVIGANIPAYDLQRVSIQEETIASVEHLTVSMDVANLSTPARATAAAQAGGDGVLYLAQWDHKDRVYWVAAEMRGNQTMFRTGTLGVIRSATSKKFITYNYDPIASQQLRGSVRGTIPGRITISIPKSLAGNFAAGDVLRQVTAYAFSERGPLAPAAEDPTVSVTALPLKVDASGAFSYRVGDGPRMDGVVELSLDDPTFASPVAATILVGIADRSWEARLDNVAAGAHTLYARQRISGRDVSPLASVAFRVAPAFVASRRVIDPSSASPQLGSEPSIELDANDVIYSSVPQGFGTVWRSNDLGASWKHLGSVDGDLEIGGGDTDLEFDALNRLYICDLVVELGLSSTVSRYTNHATMNSVVDDRDHRTLTQPLQDRQWLATHGNETVYLAFHDVGPEWIWVSPSFDGGQTFLPAMPAISDPALLVTTIPNTNDGRVVTDKRTGAIYISFAASLPEDNAKTPPFGPHKKIMLARSFDNAITWENFTVFEGPAGTALANIFPAFAIDRSGNLYVVFSANLDANLALTPTGTLNIFYTHSTDRGATWSPPVKVNADGLGSNVLPWAVGGCAGKVDIVWYATDMVGNPNFFAARGDDAPAWHVYLAQTFDGLSAAPSFSQMRISDRVMHRGQIATGGLVGQLTGTDRRLLDFFEVDHDNAGMAHVVWADTGNSPTAAAQVMYSRQTAGTGILGCAAPQPEADVSGGGFIVVSGNKNVFGLNVFAPASGTVSYKDKSSNGFTFTATRIASLVKNGNQATVTGDGTVNGVATTFSVTVVDNGEPGRNDTFSITLGTGYQASGTLGGGNVQVR